MQKLITLAMAALALIALGTPAAASDRGACVAQLMAENGLTAATARHISTTRHLSYQGQDVGTLALGSSLWNACAYAPELAAAKRSRVVVTVFKAPIAPRRADSVAAKAAVAVPAPAGAPDDRSGIIKLLLILLAVTAGLIVAPLWSERRSYIAENQKFHDENVAMKAHIAALEARNRALGMSLADEQASHDKVKGELAEADAQIGGLNDLIGRLQEDVTFNENGARKNYERRYEALKKLRLTQIAMRESAKREASMRASLAEATTRAGIVSIPLTGSLHQMLFDQEVRGTGHDNGKGLALKVVGHDLVDRGSMSRLLQVKASAPWHAAERARHEAVVIASIDLSTGEMTWQKEGILRQIHSRHDAQTWMEQHGLPWRRPDHLPAKEWVRGDGVTIIPVSQAA